MTRASLVVCLTVIGCLFLSCGKGDIIASGEDYVLTVDDLRYEIRQLGPSTSYDGTPEDRMRIVENLAARAFLTEEAIRRGYGADELPEAEREAEAQALADAYRKWRIDSRIMLPRIKTKQWIEKLDRRLHLKEMLFAAHPAAEEALAILRKGTDFDALAAQVEGRPEVIVNDYGWVVWKDLARPVANIVFALDPGEFTDIVGGSDGYHVFYLAEDEPMGVSIELLSLRSQRFVQARQQARLLDDEKADLKSLYDVEFTDDGLEAGLETFRISFTGGRPPDSLLNRLVASHAGGEVLVADLFNLYYAMPIQSRPYIGDYHAVSEFAMEIMLPALEAMAGRALGLDRLREVVWAKKKAREEFLVPFMEDEFRSQITVTDQDLKTYYEERQEDLRTTGNYTVRRILLESRSEVRQVRRELASGKDFADVARELSHDEISAPRGGQLEEVLFGLVAAYDSVVNELRPGQISEPFQTDAGIEIIKLEAVELPRQLSFEEAESMIMVHLTNTRANNVLAEWVNAREAEVGLRVNEDLLAEVRLPMPDYKSYEPKRTRTVDVSGGEEPEEAAEEAAQEEDVE
jgi:parvulin-like peptidyl-prolyl isomerase